MHNRLIILGSIIIKHFASGVRKLTPTSSAWGRLRGEQLVKLADVPGLSRMPDAGIFWQKSSLAAE